MTTATATAPSSTTSATAEQVVPSAQRAAAPADLPRIAPAIDVFEADGALVLLADVPGLTAQDLEVTIERQVLRFQGNARAPQPQGRLLHREYADVRYERSVSFSTRIDAARISATLTDGVLRIVVPKLEAVQPRKIPVTGAHAA